MEKENRIKHNVEKDELSFKIEKPEKDNVLYATKISEWTTKAGTMLPKSPNEILSFFSSEHSIVVISGWKELLSHAAATYIYKDGSIELGAVYTSEKYRGKGAATKAIKGALDMLGEKYPEQKIFALANQYSAGLFEKIGARKMQTNELSDEVWEPCSDCPNKPAKQAGVIFQCCDTPYDLTDLKNK